MPLIEVTLIQGRTPDQLRNLIHELHAGAVRALGVPDRSVRVAVREIPTTHWAAGDVTIAERDAAAADAENADAANSVAQNSHEKERSDGN